MKFLRFLISLLVLVAVLAVILVIASFSPLVQTWAARMALAHRPGIHGTLDSVSAGFGEVDVTDLHLEVDGAVLTLPSLEAKVPLASSVWNRAVVVRGLVAEGWTLDLSGAALPGAAPASGATISGSGAGPEGAQTQRISAETVERVVRRILRAWELPCRVSLDGVDLEGNVLFAGAPGRLPGHVHVVIRGGGMGGGREGVFTFESAVTSATLPVDGLAANGTLEVTMESPRQVSRIDVRGDLSANGALLWGDTPLTVEFAAVRGGGGESCTLNLSRGSRRLASAMARFPGPPGRLDGTWTVELQDADLTPFAGGHPLPALALTGEGKFDAAAPFHRVHATGRLSALTDHWGAVAAPLDRLGALKLDAVLEVDATRRSIHVARGELAVSPSSTPGGHGRRVAVLRSLQAFDFNGQTGEVKLSNPAGDLMSLAIERAPLSRLSNLLGPLRFDGSLSAGDFALRAVNGTLTLRPKSPLTASGVSVSVGNRVLAAGLDLSVLASAEYSAQGWQVQYGPLAISRAGHRVFGAGGKVTAAAGADQTVELSGNWNADFDALTASLGPAGAGLIRGRAASGDFTVKLGDSTNVEATVAMVGHDPTRRAGANISADFYPDGEISFLVPVTVTTGASVSDVSLEGTRTVGDNGSVFEVKLTGQQVALSDLRVLAAPLVAVGGAQTKAIGGRDQAPFWGTWAGHVNVAFDHVSTGDRDFTDVEGAVDLDPVSLHWARGRAKLPQKAVVLTEGSVAFDPGAKFPYQLKASVNLNLVDAATWFGPPQTGLDPAIEGRFSVAQTFTGQGGNLDDLIAFATDDLQLTSASTGGITRLLRPGAVQVSKEVSKPVTDTLDTTGSFLVGVLFGVKKDFGGEGGVAVNKTAQAVLDFADQLSEFNYDQFTITARRGYDRSLHLVKWEVIADNEHLVGTGAITYVEGLPLSQQPLSLDFHLGTRGGIADLMATAGLLSQQKDSLGYALLNQPIHFGGTLERIDASAWHDLLARAATQKPAGTKSAK